ncbi:hypothetical protein JOC94_003073 [Bacillus thermophilus]|uniref:Uncharacterized protein n=2 Tax=Siminovitchia TaxID=2837510 RepID=A0A429X9S8_SIMTE|nr:MULTISPECIES: hypothetical protein [Siminovitchia]MBM7716062.1 hypothetical protein [Siminovitchia thermophila]RST60178.1 hypothetical protein D5F11_008970 [Siminovitchia terrae]
MNLKNNFDLYEIKWRGNLIRYLGMQFLCLLVIAFIVVVWAFEGVVTSKSFNIYVVLASVFIFGGLFIYLEHQKEKRNKALKETFLEEIQDAVKMEIVSLYEEDREFLENVLSLDSLPETLHMVSHKTNSMYICFIKRDSGDVTIRKVATFISPA